MKLPSKLGGIFVKIYLPTHQSAARDEYPDGSCYNA
jgi:hypothetical protein